MQRLIVILGPTASGKSALGVKLAKKFGGEIVSADSRQIYKGLNIGAGKITKKEMAGIPHHLLDIASPKRAFSVAQYKKLAQKTIENIQKRGKIPFLVGGSPLYIYAVVDNWELPEVKPNFTLRKKLAKLSVEELYKRLQKLDPRRAKTIEKQNPRRLIRALEIILTTKKPVPQLKKNPLPYPVLFLGIKKSPPKADQPWAGKSKLKKLIISRLKKRFKQGMISEVKKLHAQGLSWQRLEQFGLEYRFIAQYLQGKLSFVEMKQKLQKAIIDFSRRQMTWFSAHGRSASGGKNPIHWISNYKQTQSLTKKFLKEN